MSDVPRLYSRLRPHRYQLHLRTFPDSDRVEATADLEAELSESATTITLHADRLEVKTATINGRPAETSLDESRQHLLLHASELVAAGKVQIKIDYQAVIRDTMHGLYRSQYRHENKEKYLLATQFEAIHAREVFPCIDEPEAKAVFELSVTAPAHVRVISNTEPARTKTEAETQTTTFEPTPKMSTYLLALIVGELDCHQRTSESGVTVRAYATPDNLDRTDFALDVATRALDFFDTYFKIPYPLAKADLVALPDFASGAMENWGCITFREALMLVDETHTSLISRQHTALVIAHELAHQWFGNLVTMQWWTDLWLNEGFASWIEYLAVDKLFPEWNIWEAFVAHEQQLALLRDSFMSSHPVEVPVRDPAEIDEIFDAISYQKGASIIHMLHEYLGPERFRTGLGLYLHRHSYDNATTHDLWRALDEMSEDDITAFMSAWTQNTGYPLVRVEQTDDQLYLSQCRFTLLDKETDEVQRWPVPVSDTVTDKRWLFRQEQASVKMPVPDYKLNRHQNGFYRVQYPPEHMRTLLGKYKHFSTLDVIGLIDDGFALAMAGHDSVINILEPLPGLADCDVYTVWSTIHDNLLITYRTFGDTALGSGFIHTLTDRQLQRLDSEQPAEESPFDTLLRPQLLGLAVRSGDTSQIEEQLQRFRSGGHTPPDLRHVQYFAAGRYGQADDYNDLWERYRNAEMAEEKSRLLSGLCAPTDPKRVHASLQKIRADEVRLQEVRHWLHHLFANHAAKEPAWQWLQDNWNWVEENFRHSHLFPDIPKIVARGFTDTQKAEELQRFFAPVMPERSLQQALEQIRINAAWYERDHQPLANLNRRFD